MKITFFSNFLNHHQTPLCDELYKQLGGEFTFVSTEKIPDSFLINGYSDCSNYEYNLNSYVDSFNYQKALQLAIDSDIVIIGSAPEVFIKSRIRLNKLTFRYSERVFKKGIWMLFDPRILRSLFLTHTQFRRNNMHLLCASAYMANDMNLIMAYPNKKYQWGYFTKIPEIDINDVISNKPKKIIEILWVGRFIDWKHPELAIELALKLKQRGYIFRLTMIGSGPLIDKIKKLIKKFDLFDVVFMTGSMPNSEVREYMSKSNIFIFTSDQNEGWGAVLNEAMSYGCAVVASNTIGSTPYLIDHKKNGLIFKSGSLNSLLAQVEVLILNQSLRNQLSLDAYYKIVNNWSPKIAATNFLTLAYSILDGKDIFFENGPCAKAKWVGKKY